MRSIQERVTARGPASKVALGLHSVAAFLLLLAVVRQAYVLSRPLLSATPPASIPVEHSDGEAFGLPERTRRAIFDSLASAEVAERARAVRANTWGGHAWSREDDRGHYERVAARAAAAKYGVSLTQVYLVLDEALREHWLGPDGKPLPALTPPLNPRSTW